MAAPRKYSEETRRAIIADVLAGERRKDVGEKYGVPAGTISKWPELSAKEAVPDVNGRVNRTFDKAFKYEVAKAVIDGVITRQSALEQYQLATSVLSAWVKDVRTGKLKGPRKKPGPKPQHEHEIVEAPPSPVRPVSTQLALPVTPPQSRVINVHEELARKDATIAELEKKLRKMQKMLNLSLADDDD